MNLSDITKIDVLLQDLESKGFDTNHIPVDVERLALLYGVSIDDRFHPEHADKIATVQGNQIWINPVDANEYTALRRHVIAHELGHIVLHKPDGAPLHFMDTSNSLRGRGIDVPQVELECNEFAAELLIPVEPLTDLLTSEKDLLKGDFKRTIQRVAEVFDVPVSLVGQRFSLFAK